MPDENGNPLPGEKGHWRFKKDLALSKERHGTTGMKDLTGSKEKKPERPLPVVEKVYDAKGAKAFNRQEQLNLLEARKVKVPSKAKEAKLVELILKSNPKE